MPLTQQGCPMSIDENTAARVAKLARIRVEEADLPALAQEFNVEPMTSVTPMRLKRREDLVSDGNRQGEILANAPDAREGFFAVPKVVE